MSIESDPIQVSNPNNLSNLPSEPNRQALELIQNVVLRLGEARRAMACRQLNSDIRVDKDLRPDIEKSNPSLTQYICAEDPITDTMLGGSSNLTLKTMITKNITNNSLDGRVREDIAKSSLVKKKRNRLNLSLLKNERAIANSQLTHIEFYRNNERYVYATEEIRHQSSHIKREVGISGVDGVITVRQITNRPKKEPKISSWTYTPGESAGTSASKEALVAQRIASRIIDRCLNTLETHSTQGTVMQLKGNKLNISRSEREESISITKK